MSDFWTTDQRYEQMTTALEQLTENMRRVVEANNVLATTVSALNVRVQQLESRRG